MQIVPLGPKHTDPFSETADAGSLVWVGGCRDSQHLQRTVVHRFNVRIQPDVLHEEQRDPFI